MNSLETASPEDKNEILIESFISVLECSKGEATFFLESSNWNIETAISLCIEGGDRNFTSKRQHNKNYDDSLFRESLRPALFYGKVVEIEGLSSDWTAKVSSTTGCIYFIHNESGHTQHSVPPGFADASDEHKNYIGINDDNNNSMSTTTTTNNNKLPGLLINCFRDLDNPFTSKVSGVNPFGATFQSNDDEKVKELGNGYELGEFDGEEDDENNINTSHSNIHDNNVFDIDEDDEM
jgi:hypothetical protein